VILSGEVTLRSPEGFQKLSQGDVVFFEEGAEGAHQLYNHKDSPCIYLDLRTTIGIDVCEYPDSGKLNILPNIEVFESSSSVDYYKGEENVVTKWPKELLQNNKQPTTAWSRRREDSGFTLKPCKIDNH